MSVDVIGYARSSVPPALEVELEPLAAAVVSLPFVVEGSERPTVDVWSVIEVSDSSSSYLPRPFLRRRRSRGHRIFGLSSVIHQ